MKTPEQVKQVLARQWQSADTRECRLLGGGDEWPIEISIGVPTASDMVSRLSEVKQHIDRWRQVTVGEIVWSPKTYRSTSDAISLPMHWRLARPSDWVAGCNDRQVTDEFESLAELIGASDPIFHQVLVRRRSLWRDKPIDEVVLATTVAMQLQPAIAEGRPLRTLSLTRTDTKFFERNANLMTTLLDQRFDGEPSRMGLTEFLGALSETDHWVLVVDLDGRLLPFERLRVRCSELKTQALQAQNILIIENETCAHLLPKLPGTIAVLGSGFDLGWTSADWLAEKRIAYWGDIDTWGLAFLAQARRNQPHLIPLMMDVDTFDAHEDAAVPEPVPASIEPPSDVDADRTTTCIDACNLLHRAGWNRNSFH